MLMNYIPRPWYSVKCPPSFYKPFAILFKNYLAFCIHIISMGTHEKQASWCFFFLQFILAFLSVCLFAYSKSTKELSARIRVISKWCFLCPSLNSLVLWDFKCLYIFLWRYTDVYLIHDVMSCYVCTKKALICEWVGSNGAVVH